MTSEMHGTLLDRTRAVLRDVLEAFSLLIERTSSSDKKNAVLMQDVAERCSPAMRRQQLLGLCDEIEMILDARVSGWLRASMEQEISSLEQSLRALSASSIHVSHDLSRYAGLVGYIRAIADLRRTGFSSKLLTSEPSYDDLGSSISGFGDALASLICALEGAISQHTGQLFRYNTTEQSP